MKERWKAAFRRVKKIGAKEHLRLQFNNYEYVQIFSALADDGIDGKHFDAERLRDLIAGYREFMLDNVSAIMAAGPGSVPLRAWPPPSPRVAQRGAAPCGRARSLH